MKLQENVIAFVLDDKIKIIDFAKTPSLKPTTTVLNYLRSLPGHKGVKEGCSEGDCGACTVVLGEMNGEGMIKYTAVDSCLVFLPMIHGKQIVTVENLSPKTVNPDELHPVQKYMVNQFGSQCGYCTPGFIMSLFALYKNHKNPSREVILDSLTGNLCRCTGYQPIIDAAQEACKEGTDDRFTQKEPYIYELLEDISNATETISIVTDKQKYFRSVSIQDALELRLEYPEAIIVNGSTDIALRQTKKNELLKEIIDISGIGELKNFREEKDRFVFGAGMSLESVKRESEKKFPALYGILKVFGSLQIRSLASIGGNIGSASPIGDTLPVLIAYDASVMLKNLKGEREMKLKDFIKGYRKTDLQKDEIISEVKIPFTNKNVIVKSYKVSKRKDLDISTVSAAFRLNLDKENVVNEIVMAYGGMAAFTKEATAAEEFVTGKKWNRETVENAMEIIYSEFEPLSDARAGMEFRRIAAKNLLMKFYMET